jgi:hypothetical protein
VKINGVEIILIKFGELIHTILTGNVLGSSQIFCKLGSISLR